MPLTINSRLSVCHVDEQKGTIEYDQEGERITVNFDTKLEVMHC
jgi:hypothetical protein